MGIPQKVKNWLLEESNPSIRYRTLTELLDYSINHIYVINSMKTINDTRNVKAIFSQISDDGEWPWIDSYDAPEYGIGYLAELAADCTVSKIHNAIENYLDAQLDDGSFYSSYYKKKNPPKHKKNDSSCYYGLTLRGLAKLGYRDDERFKKAINFALSEARWDGGYLCTKSYVKKKTKSCYRGSKNMLLLFSELPELWDSDQCKALVNYFLDRNIIYARNDHTKLVQGIPSTVFPFHYRFGLVEVLYALSKMGLGNRKEVIDTWKYMESKKDDIGRYYLDWTMPKCSFNPGKKGEPNKWITFYAYLALKHKAHYEK